MGFTLDSFTDSNVIESPETPVQIQLSFLAVLSLYRSREAPRAPEVEAPVIFRQSAYEGGKIVSPTHRPPLPQEIFLLLVSVSGIIHPRAVVRSEVLSQ